MKIYKHTQTGELCFISADHSRLNPDMTIDKDLVHNLEIFSINHLITRSISKHSMKKQFREYELNIYQLISNFKLSEQTIKNFKELHSDLKILFLHTLRYYDLVILEANRGEEAQNKYFESGASKARFLQSPHNYMVALAGDVSPFPVKWNKEEMSFLGGMIMGFSYMLQDAGVFVDKGFKWGGKWSKSRICENSFVDRPHFQLLNWKDFKKVTKERNDRNFSTALQAYLIKFPLRKSEIS